MGRPVRGPALLEPGESLHFPGSPFAAVGEPAVFFVLAPTSVVRSDRRDDTLVQGRNEEKVVLMSSEPPSTRT